MIPARRRFTILDALVLIAATAVGLAWAMPRLDDLRRFGHRARQPDAYEWLVQGLEWFGPIVLAWTLAVLGLRLLRPRPDRRRLLRQPGFNATLAVGVGTLLTVAGASVSVPLRAWIYRLKDPWSALWDETGYPLLALLSSALAVGVATTWASLALSGRWRPEPSWIDRAGRLLGAYWLVAGTIVGIDEHVSVALWRW